ncbi:hypothetical protein ERC79_01800 [Rhodococcus sp. ABRD24]|uniref:hypothetical protein n=1 Tax=Rhodococcus sp. ABRD24 TaxID=2507582 RepID=UPI00103DBFA4|nr:hypothetical protein [Rhodococcus sp. ABRD24]QBJ94839.1 hypothetical protein ERC79_01800 [Rhodococcus sp. ABRD24]
MSKWPLPIGRAFGERLYLNRSLLVTLGLTSALLDGSVLRADYGGLSTALYRAVGGLAPVVFVASSAVPEVTHSVVAVHNGVQVRRITPWWWPPRSTVDRLARPIGRPQAGAR